MKEGLRSYAHRVVDKLFGDREQRDYSPSPFARVYFATGLEHVRAERLVASYRSVVALPGPSLAVDVSQLYILKDAGVNIYRAPELRDRESGWEQPLDIDEAIKTLRKVQLLISEGKSPRNYLK